METEGEEESGGWCGVPPAASRALSELMSADTSSGVGGCWLAALSRCWMSARYCSCSERDAVAEGIFSARLPLRCGVRAWPLRLGGAPETRPGGERGALLLPASPRW